MLWTCYILLESSIYWQHYGPLILIKQLIFPDGSHGLIFFARKKQKPVNGAKSPV
jgi:hypothetical protein